jgi:hypothetical protein
MTEFLHVKSQRLTFINALQQLHKNVNNIIMHLINLRFFLTKIKKLMKQIMITIFND